MEINKREALEKAGWTFGDAAEFLGLSNEDREILEFRLKVSREPRRLREGSLLTQRQLANRIGSSQSRVAKIESASQEVSLDLMLRGFFAVGGRLSFLVAQAERPAGSTSPEPKRPKAGNRSS